MKWWKARYKYDGIELEEVEISRATDQNVWIKGDRLARTSPVCCFYEKKEDAVNYLAGRAGDELKRAQYTIKKVEEILSHLNTV